MRHNTFLSTIQVYKDYYHKMPVSSFSFDANKIYAGGYSDLSILINPGRPSRVITNHIIVSENNGLYWSTLESGLPSEIIVSNSSDKIPVIQTIHAAGSHLLVGMRAYSTYKGGGIYHLINAGSEWAIADSSLMGNQIYNFAAYGLNVYAATTKGIFRSSDYGSTWTDASYGLSDSSITSLVVSGDYLFAATPSGVWKRPLSEITSVEINSPGEKIPNKFSLSQNYPNPFNPVTRINYSVPQSGLITLKVYNLLGEDIAELFNGFQHTGNYSAVFDGGKLSSGIYLYQLKANDFVQTKKLVLLK